MSNVAISVENLSKRYRLGKVIRPAAGNQSLLPKIAAPFRYLASTLRAAPEDEILWALKDVSFEAPQGKAIGIIGRNGAGKSTLLKILSRITEPTSGRAVLNGRVGSLLEVGTGFHPELTGRENIYLNGAILGMQKAGIDRKFDEIVDFAEIEKFLDTPVKRYSSGMYVRLAFAVAAHLETEILLVDEVLAVGDAEFQKKCLGKMGSITNEDRTILFVSHNLSAITRLCQKGILLERGKLKLFDTIEKVATTYMQSDLGASGQRHWDYDTAPGDNTARLKSVKVISNGAVTDVVDIRHPIIVEMEFWNLKEGAELFSAFSFVNELGNILFVSADFDDPNWGKKPRNVGVYRASCEVPGNFFAEGQISVIAEVSTRHPMYEIHVLEHDSLGFHVIDKNEPGSVRSGWGRKLPGLVRPALKWVTSLIEDKNQE